MTQKVCDKCRNLIPDINDTIFISGESAKHSSYSIKDVKNYILETIVKE